MYAAPTFVDSQAAVPLLPDCMYGLPSFLAGGVVTADAATPMDEARRAAAEEAALCRLRRLQGNISLIARLRGVSLDAGSANQKGGASAANQKGGGGLANRKAAVGQCPESLSLHCAPDRAPVAALALLVALRRAGKRVHVTSHEHSSAVGGRRLPPALADAIGELVAANPLSRAACDLCATLIWRPDQPECSVAGDVFNGHPLLGEALALRALNLAAGRPLPEDWPLLDFADQLLDSASNSDARLLPLLAASEGKETLGKILLCAEMRRARRKLPPALAEVAASPLFADFADRLLPAAS